MPATVNRAAGSGFSVLSEDVQYGVGVQYFSWHKTALFPAYEEEREETKEEDEDEGEDKVEEEDEDTCLWWRLCQFPLLTSLQESPLATLSPAMLSMWLMRLLAGVWRAAVGLRGDSGIPAHVQKENSQH